MAYEDVYEVSLVGSYLGQLTNNVFYYQQRLPTGGASGVDAMQALMTEFEAVLQTPLQNALSNAVNFNLIAVRNLFTPAENAQRIINWTGTQSGADALPAHDAIAFRLGGPQGIPRDGSKRFAGLTEGNQVGGALNGTQFILLLQSIADAFEGTLTGTVNSVTYAFRPVVVKRVVEIISGKRTYRLPENLAETVLKFVVNAAVSLIVSTQGSRKPGRGR